MRRVKVLRNEGIGLLSRFDLFQHLFRNLGNEIWRNAVALALLERIGDRLVDGRLLHAGRLCRIGVVSHWGVRYAIDGLGPPHRLRFFGLGEVGDRGLLPVGVGLRFRHFEGIGVVC
jgi:hypothetical protein